jgi:hypothetical protein
MSLHDHTSLKPSWLPADARVTSRALIHPPAFLMTPGGEPFSATVIDIATHGFRVQSNYPAKMGQFVVIEVPAFARYSGWVAWAHAGEFGLDVANPLPEPVVDHIISLALQD